MGWCRHDPNWAPTGPLGGPIFENLPVVQNMQTFLCRGGCKQTLCVVAARVAFPHMEARAGCSPVSPCRGITVSRAT